MAGDHSVPPRRHLCGWCGGFANHRQPSPALASPWDGLLVQRSRTIDGTREDVGQRTLEQRSGASRDGRAQFAVGSQWDDPCRRKRIGQTAYQALRPRTLYLLLLLVGNVPQRRRRQQLTFQWPEDPEEGGQCPRRLLIRDREGGGARREIDEESLSCQDHQVTSSFTTEACVGAEQRQREDRISIVSSVTGAAGDLDGQPPDAERIDMRRTAGTCVWPALRLRRSCNEAAGRVSDGGVSSCRSMPGVGLTIVKMALVQGYSPINFPHGCQRPSLLPLAWGLTARAAEAKPFEATTKESPFTDHLSASFTASTVAFSAGDETLSQPRPVLNVRLRSDTFAPVPGRVEIAPSFLKPRRSIDSVDPSPFDIGFDIVRACRARLIGKQKDIHSFQEEDTLLLASAQLWTSTPSAPS
ncbi:hypothetical protein P154DRAFT_573740 [Amniculicola lignicola CBS 123094]|uniref:Uncharacterized protein n=1 Tax=Amniculicola lignicola CBS 123094 TaxID=1392246 RepID=A0A6A5WLT2_9PLEO|nr:hypothetical protein P154DRAFT_573740 [Amniculicola lignicola CBS 123094]